MSDEQTDAAHADTPATPPEAGGPAEASTHEYEAARALPGRRTPAWRRPIVIAASLVALVLVAIGGFAVAQQNSIETRDRSIRETATNYLTAIADGQADAALALVSHPPASRELLTDDVLKASAAAAPLTEIAVTGFEAGPDSATVAVTYKLGAEPVTTHLTLEGDGHASWKVAGGLSELMVTNTAGLKVNGAQITRTVNPVFPGTYTASPSIDQIALDGAPTVTIPAPATTSATIEVTPKLSEAGLTQSREAAKAKYDGCLASTSSEPPGCPWRLDTTGVTVESVRYSGKNDPWATFTPTLDLATMTAKGTAHFTLDAATTATQTATGITGELSLTLDRDTPVTVDLSTQPLKVTFG